MRRLLGGSIYLRVVFISLFPSQMRAAFIRRRRLEEWIRYFDPSALSQGSYRPISVIAHYCQSILLHQLFQDLFNKFSACDDLKVGIFCKGAKVNNKDNYRSITLLPTLCKIYEMILLNRLEKCAAQMGFFSEMQFGFQKDVDALKPHSLLLRQWIICWSVVANFLASCFLDVRKAFDTVWIDGVFTNYFRT